MQQIKIEEIEPIRIDIVQWVGVTLSTSIEPEFEKVHEVSNKFNDDQNAVNRFQQSNIKDLLEIAEDQSGWMTLFQMMDRLIVLVKVKHLKKIKKVSIKTKWMKPLLVNTILW